MDAQGIMGLVTMAVTVLMFMTGIPPCYNMWKKRSTKNVPYHLFLIGAIGCIGNLHYSILLGNGTLVFLNGFGSLLLVTYTLLYLMVVTPKGQPIGMLLVAAAVIYGAYAYLGGLPADEFRPTLGRLAACATTVYACLPALELINNVVGKNADGVPLVMVLGSVACASCWLTYGIMLGDPNIYMPNYPGLTISSCKLLVHIAYGGAPKRHLKKT